MRIDFCIECKLLIGWVNYLKIEKEKVHSYYIKEFGYFDIKTGCDACEKELNKIVMLTKDREPYNIILYVNSTDLRYMLNEVTWRFNKWYYFILSKEKIEEEKIDFRIKGVVDEYTLLRYKENAEYKTYQIFGYNGTRLYIKQTIGVKKDIE